MFADGCTPTTTRKTPARTYSRRQTRDRKSHPSLSGPRTNPVTIRIDPMRFWLSRNSTVSLREQLATQLVLGVISEDLKPGELLPSVRELARIYNIHFNTVSAVYHDLV